MQFRKTIIRLLIFFLPNLATAQSTNLPQGSRHEHFLDRLEILMQDNPSLNFSGWKPISRKTAVGAAETADSLDKTPGGFHAAHLSAADRYNLKSLLMNNAEWVSGDKSSFLGTRPVWNTFYKSKADFFAVDQKDFFLAVNPVIQEQQSVESGNGERVFLNTRGVTARGLIAQNVGFDFYLTDNQERPPAFAKAYFDNYHAVPGAGFYKPFKTTAYDYFDARGSVHFGATKYFRFQFGYDKNVIGNGYRSLLLSDFSSNYLFLKINTRIWKLDYTNLYMELFPQNASNPGNILLPRKYATLHRLSINATKWLNVGVTESVIFARPDRFDFSYLNPVIFLRSIEQQNGSPDNALVGFDVKANIAHRLQLYGQFLLDEFVLKELRAGNGWWGNKFGIQAGGKYINAFSVKNLDLQGEINLVRPFTYTHNSIVANYTHYNQPLAHPLGAGFIEAIGIARFQPHQNWNMEIKVIAFSKGIDTGSSNLGNNIFLSSDTRAHDYGYRIPSGIRSKGVNASAWLSYMLRENLFIEGSLLVRNVSAAARPDLSSKTTVLTLGLRMNMFRREYDY